MKGKRDPIVSRKLKLVSDLINTFENLKRANIPRAELPAGQPQLYVPRGEPDPLSWLVGRVWMPSPVSLELLCSYGSLEADVGTVPHPRCIHSSTAGTEEDSPDHGNKGG